MLECKPSRPLLSAKTQISTTFTPPLVDATEYRDLVGCLQYLTFTHSNILYVVPHVAQLVSSTHNNYMLAFKRMLRYLNYNLDLGIVFHPSTDILSLHAYLNANWAGFPYIRCDTTSYCVFLVSNLFS